MVGPLCDLSSSFAQRIRKLRDNRGESLVDVATAIGISKTHLHYLESGRSANPCLNIIHALCLHYGVPAAVLTETSATIVFRE